MTSLYMKFEYPNVTTEQLVDNIIAENMISKVDSEGHYYQLLTEVTDPKKGDSDIDKLDGFINSSSVNSRKMRAVCAEPDINTRRHITAVKPLQPVFVDVHAHKIINNVFLSYYCQLLIISSPPP